MDFTLNFVTIITTTTIIIIANINITVITSIISYYHIIIINYSYYKTNYNFIKCFITTTIKVMLYINS